MSVTRISNGTGVVELQVASGYSPEQRLAGLGCAGQSLGMCAVQAVASIATLPLLPLGTPVWLGLGSAASLRQGLSTLYRATLGAPPPGPDLDMEWLTVLCLDVQHTFDGGDVRDGVAAAAQLLTLAEVDLGDWRDTVREVFRRGVAQEVDDALAAARQMDEPHRASAALGEALNWLRTLPMGVETVVEVRHGREALEHASRVEAWWVAVLPRHGELLQAMQAGDWPQGEEIAASLLRSAPRTAWDDRRVVALTALLQEARQARLAGMHAAMQGAVNHGDWPAARRAARALLAYGAGSLGESPEVLQARQVLERAAALLGQPVVDFDTMEAAARQLGYDRPWRMRQIADARLLLGPATTMDYDTLADEIVARPPGAVYTPRIIHRRLPHLFYHPEINRHGPYIKLVPQMMLAAFACARRRDGDDRRMRRQRAFFADAFTDLCFEGRASAMMRYVEIHPLDDAPSVDTEVILEIASHMDDEARVCEHFRVYNAVQLRRYAQDVGIDFRGDDWSSQRPRLEASAAYGRDYCNPQLFAAYLREQDFVRERADRDALVARLVTYLTDVIGIFSSETNA